MKKIDVAYIIEDDPSFVLGVKKTKKAYRFLSSHYGL